MRLHLFPTALFLVIHSPYFVIKSNCLTNNNGAIHTQVVDAIVIKGPRICEGKLKGITISHVAGIE